jgi:hypothetical protein
MVTMIGNMFDEKSPYSLDLIISASAAAGGRPD